MTVLTSLTVCLLQCASNSDGGTAGGQEDDVLNKEIQKLNAKLARDNAEQNARQSEKSFWVLGVTNPVRKICIQLASNTW